MTSKFADKSGSITPSVTGCGGNYRMPGVLLGSRRNRRRPVAYAHQIERRGHESEHPAHPFLSAVRRFPEIADGFRDFIHPFAQVMTDDVARMAGGSAIDERMPFTVQCFSGSHAAVAVSAMTRRKMPLPSPLDYWKNGSKCQVICG